MTYKHSNITDFILKAFFNVYYKLNDSFLEKVYKNEKLLEFNNLRFKGG